MTGKLLQRLLVVCTPLIVCLVSPAAASPVAVGDPAPFFQLTGMDRKNHGIQDYRGKVVLLNFWASWCGPCRKELPMLDQLQRDYPDKVTVLAINIDQELSNVQRFLKKYPVDCNILLDAESDTASRFGIQAMPASYIIDQNGVVRYQHRGFNPSIDPQIWRQEIGKLLGASL